MYAFCTYLKQIQTNTYQYLLEVFICIYVHIFAYIFVSKILLLTYSKANRHTFVSICQWTYLHTYSSMPLPTWIRHPFVARHPESASLAVDSNKGAQQSGRRGTCSLCSCQGQWTAAAWWWNHNGEQGQTYKYKKCQLQPNRILTSK